MRTSLDRSQQPTPQVCVDKGTVIATSALNPELVAECELYGGAGDGRLDWSVDLPNRSNRSNGSDHGRAMQNLRD